MMTNFHRMESEGVAVLGATPTFYGSPSFSSCMFGNGINSDASTKYVIFSSVLNTAQGCVEYWFKPNSAVGNTYRSLFYSNNFGGTDSYAVYNQQATPRLYCAVSNSAQYVYNLSFTSGEIFHFAFVWDRTAGTNQKIKVFKNGVIVNLEAVNGSDVSWTTSADANLNLATWSATYTAKGIIDNVKVFNNAKTDFSDRFNERGGLNDVDY